MNHWRNSESTVGTARTKRAMGCMRRDASGLHCRCAICCTVRVLAPPS